MSRTFTNMGLSDDSGAEVTLPESAVTLDMSDLDDEMSIAGDAFPGTYGDFAAGTTITWGDGDMGDACGFAFRDDTGQYRITINQHSELNFQDDDALSVYGYDYNTIQSDGDNELALLAVGEQFNVYINGKLVWQFSDDTHTEGAISPVGMNMLAGDDSACSFSDTWLRDLSNVDDIALRMPLGLPPSTIASLTAIGLVPNDGDLNIYIPENVLEMTADKNSASVYLDEDYSNFVFGTTFMYAGAAGSNTEHVCRVDFRLTPNNNYRLQLNRNGDIGLSPTIDGNQQDTLENRAESAANLRSADGQPNDLAIVAYNDELRVYVNHMLVGDFEDSQLDDGIIGLIGNISGEADAGCNFMDSWVWTMNDDTSALEDLISLPDTPAIEAVAVAIVPTATPVPPTAAPTDVPPPTAAPTDVPPPTAVPTDVPPPTIAPTDVPPPTAVPTEASLIPDVVHLALAEVGIPSEIGTLKEYFPATSSFNMTTESRFDGVVLPEPYDNFVLGATLTFEGENLGGNHACSIFFRDDGNGTFYRLVFQRDNLIGLLYLTGGQSYVLRWQEFRNLNTESSVPSKIVFAANGSSFNIYVDGQLVPGSFDDTRLTTGQISLLGSITNEANPGGGVACTYTDTWIWVPN